MLVAESTAMRNIDHGARKRVLVVDDDVVVARTLAHQLDHAGFETRYVLSGEEALGHLKAESYDVLLTDICMPSMRGDELQRLAGQLDPDLAVVMITGTVDVSGAVDCMRAGADDYLMKPVRIDDLVTQIGKATERHRLIREEQAYRANLELRVAEAVDHVRKVFHNSLETLSNTLNAKDSPTRDHSRRVSELASSIAKHMCPDNAEFQIQVRVGSLFHDIGKIGVREEILAKPGPLTLEEEIEIRRHPEIGESILRPIFAGSDILKIVRSHHEHLNGGGYPDGLFGDQISLGARIVAVADSYDAMSHPRPYRGGLAIDHAVQILADGAGEQWDPDVVSAFLEVLGTQELGRSDDAAGRISTLDASKSRRPIVFVHSDLDKKAINRLETKIEALRRRGTLNFVVDLRHAGYLSKGGAEVFWCLHQMILAEGGRMALRDTPEQALAMFRRMGRADKLALERTPISKADNRLSNRQAAKVIETDDVSIDDENDKPVSREDSSR